MAIIGGIIAFVALFALMGSFNETPRQKLDREDAERESMLEAFSQKIKEENSWRKEQEELNKRT